MNFFNVADAWHTFQSSEKPDYLKKLVYTSIEGFPLRKKDLQSIINRWSDRLSSAGISLSSQLLDAYPLPIKGIYSFQFESIELNLIYMRLDQALSEFEPKGIELFDCLFLDGFAPSKNQAMWQPSNLRRLSFLCNQNATFSTFTAASSVRRCMINCGFSITRKKGFGRKREMLTGNKQHRNDRVYKSKTPWYQHSSNHRKSNNPVVIIGGGVAGSATANALAQKGIKSLILEQSPRLGGTCALLKRSLYSPYFSADFNLASQFYWHAYHYLNQFLCSRPEVHHQRTGIFFIADNQSRKEYLSNAYKILAEFDDEFKWLDADQSKLYTGISVDYPGLFSKHGGWVNGESLCENLSADTLIQSRTNTTVDSINLENNVWTIQTNTESITSDHVILCMGWRDDLLKFFGLCRLDSIKGQTTSISNFSNTESIKTILNNGHYLIPAEDNSNALIFGASYERINVVNFEPNINADIENLVAFKHLNGDFSESIQANVTSMKNQKLSTSDTGIRLTTRDHLPLIGPVPDMDFYQNNYPDILKTGRLKGCPQANYIPGLYVNTAHGSRGVTASILSGKLISAMMTGEFRPLPSSLFKSIHPARFFIRDQLNKFKTAIF